MGALQVFFIVVVVDVVGDGGGSGSSSSSSGSSRCICSHYVNAIRYLNRRINTSVLYAAPVTWNKHQDSTIKTGPSFKQACV